MAIGIAAALMTLSEMNREYKAKLTDEHLEQNMATPKGNGLDTFSG